MDRINIYLFGPPHFESRGNILDIRLRKPLGLFAYLAVTGKAHTRDTLATLFWPEADQQSGRSNLRRSIYNLKKAAGENVIAAAPEQVGINPEADLWIDVRVFDTSAGLQKTSDFNDGIYSHLAEAAHLFCGDFMAGFNLPDCPEFDEWQFFQREHYHQKGLQLLDRLVEMDVQNGRFQQAISFARKRLSFDRLHEPAHRKLLQLYAQTGEKAAAIRQFSECERILKLELGAKPQPETIHILDSIKNRRQNIDARQGPLAPKTRYVKSGNTYIAYQTMGQGPVDILLVSGFVSHIEHMWNDPGLSSFLHRLGRFARLIVFDKRGIGLSDRIGDPPTLENTLEDIQAVLKAAGSGNTILLGASEGGPAVIQYAFKHPRNILGLILYGTMAKGTKSDNYPFALTRSQYDKWLERLISSWGGPCGIGFFAPSRKTDPQLRMWWSDMLKLSSSPGNVRLVLEALRDIDVRPLLPRVKVPALILHRKEDKAVRVGAGRYLSELIPNNQYVELDGADHWWWIADVDAIIHQIRQFCSRFA